MKKQILCLSRAYLSRLFPAMAARHAGADYFHIVQTDAEEADIRAQGGNVVLNLERVVREGMARDEATTWREPADFRAVTEFDWSPIYSDRSLVNFAPALRDRIAGILHAAVADVFARHRFDAFVSEPVAIFITHLLFYYCRKHGTRPLLWANSYWPDYFYFVDATDLTQPIRTAPVTDAEAEALRQKVETFVDGVAQDKAGPIYHHAFSGVRNSRLGYFKQRKGELPLVLRPGWSSQVLQLLRLGRASYKRLRFPGGADYITAGSVAEHKAYMRFLMTPRRIYDAPPAEYSADNVVYSLQYEPEASLLYFGAPCADQIAFVETLLRALPDGKVLWVKEHPNQFGALGARRWRELKRRYHNLRFVHGRENGRYLLRCGPLMVTITSSMGMDALIQGRRVLVAGDVFYNTFTGATQVRSYEALARALNEPVNYTPSDNAAANVGEMAAFGLGCYPGDPQPSATLFSEANLDALVRAVDVEAGRALTREATA
ncbi:hypothetical protein CEG14_24855 [Bordetella genomosp. 1]|uniref:Capsular biosynthesis protein n=1 Tax=Bordetella genomosp. 1 TaxID=1395607 RepID=A0A261RSV3_9BORD|nr:hypothetical protein [Bordetella genomosp. 1]OZI28146.1 hypothetical protein CEG14_24855 [Bordetella genomosp. 1]